MDKIELREIGPSFAKEVYDIYKDEKVFENLGASFPFEIVTVDFERKFLENNEVLIKEKKEFAKGIFYNNKLVGFVGTKGIDYKKNEVEFGYWLGSKYWKKGITSKAVEKFVKEFFQNIKINRIYANVFTNNIGSIRVLEKNGFKQFDQKKVFIKSKNKEFDEYCFELKRADVVN